MKWLFLLVGFWLSNFCLADSDWEYVSLFGHSMSISHNRDEMTYSFTSEDVTQIVDSCNNREYIICAEFSRLGIAIPKNMPKVGTSWEMGSKIYTLQYVIDRLKLFNTVATSVLVIEVNERVATRHQLKHKLIYSYKEGLISFEDISNDQIRTPYLASQIPSLGND